MSSSHLFLVQNTAEGCVLQIINAMPVRSEISHLQQIFLSMLCKIDACRALLCILQREVLCHACEHAECMRLQYLSLRSLRLEKERRLAIRRIAMIRDNLRK